MQLWKASVAGLLTFAGLSLTAHAQVIPTAPAIPPAASGLGGLGAAGGTSAVSGLAGAAQPRTLWSFFGISKANCQVCKEKFCASNLGTMVNSALGPMGALTGGLVGSCCPTVPTANQLAAIAAGPGGPGGAAAVAAKIKADEADAKARVAAVEYLGTVDCRRWPDASEALANALRGDKNECVRYAAARVLNNGCCCTKLTIDALKNTLATNPDDSRPVESSERVRAAAMVALQHCQFLNPETVEPPAIKGEDPTPTPPPPAGEKPGTASTAANDPAIQRSTYMSQVSRKPTAQVMAEARRELENARKLGPPTMMTTGSRSLMNAFARSRSKPPGQSSGYAQSNAGQGQGMIPPQPMVAPPAYAPADSDPSVVGTSATIPTPVERRPAAGARSLSDVFNRSRNRPGQ